MLVVCWWVGVGDPSNGNCKVAPGDQRAYAKRQTDVTSYRYFGNSCPRYHHTESDKGVTSPANAGKMSLGECKAACTATAGSNAW